MLYFALVSVVLLAALLAWLLSVRKSNPFHIVQTLMAEGRYDEALQKLTPMSEDVDLAPRAYIYLAECHELLGTKEQAREFYRKAIDAGAFEDREREIEIYRKIAEIYRAEGDNEGFFECCLEILRLSPEDELANQEVGLLALGDGHFHIAERYLAAALQVADAPLLSLAHTVSLWQLGERDNAIAQTEKLLADGKPPDNAELLYATMATYGAHLARGKQASLRLISQTKESGLLQLLLNIYLYQCYQSKSLREALDFLKRQNEGGNLPEERKRDYQYLLLLLYLSEEMFLEASRIYREVAGENDEYKELRHLKVFIDQIDLNPHAEDLKPFQQILRDNFEPLLQTDLVYAISGFRKNRGIAIDKFFDRSGEVPSLRIEYDTMTAEKGNDLMLQMTPEDFQKFIIYIITKLEYNEPVKEASGEKDLILYSAISAKSKSIRALFAFYRVRIGTHISDISIRNLQNKMQTLRADKTYIVSSAQLTEGAGTLLRAEPSLKQFDGEHLAEWLHDYYKAARR